MPCNYQAWHWFNEIAKRDRPITGFGGLLYLPRLTVLRICEYHGLDMDTAEKILLIAAPDVKLIQDIERLEKLQILGFLVFLVFLGFVVFLVFLYPE